MCSQNFCLYVNDKAMTSYHFYKSCIKSWTQHVKGHEEGCHQRTIAACCKAGHQHLK
ncbi:hypothetical protein O3G_MSEX006662 [Manduca sexta]|uniref:Uncharacterized protein n=1 Tax=Manduca sexta TaxID=7130 RepID=A0A922CKR3_MANSE|nr:hypothetical protein O3G_MSEX006662 [Manduca sexta]